MCDSNSALSLQGKELHVDIDALHLENDFNTPTNQISPRWSHDYILKSGASFYVIDYSWRFENK